MESFRMRRSRKWRCHNWGPKEENETGGWEPRGLPRMWLNSPLVFRTVGKCRKWTSRGCSIQRLRILRTGHHPLGALRGVPGVARTVRGLSGVSPCVCVCVCRGRARVCELRRKIFWCPQVPICSHVLGVFRLFAQRAVFQTTTSTTPLFW